MRKDEITARNLIIGAEFDRFIIEHPELLDQIPDRAQIVFIPEYDPELSEENMRLSKSIREKDKPVVYIRLKKLAPRKSRIRQIRIELAKAGQLS